MDLIRKSCLLLILALALPSASFAESEPVSDPQTEQQLKALSLKIAALEKQKKLILENDVKILAELEVLKVQASRRSRRTVQP